MRNLLRMPDYFTHLARKKEESSGLLSVVSKNSTFILCFKLAILPIKSDKRTGKIFS